MAKQVVERHFVHFMVNGVTAFVEIDPKGDKWCHMMGKRMAYGAMQGKLKSTAHSVMSQHNLVSAWRG